MKNIYILLMLIIFIVPIVAEDSYQSKPRLEDNFYQNKNYNWLKSIKIPDSEPGINSFFIIKNEKIDKRLRSLLESNISKSKIETKVRDAYLSFMDTKKRDMLGLSPIKKIYLEKIDKIHSYRELAILMANFLKDGIIAPMVFFVMPDLKEGEKYALYIAQAGLFLSKDSYLKKDARSVKQRKVYREFLEELFTLAHDSNPDKKAKQIIELETKLAKYYFSPAENRDFAKLYNKTTISKLSKILNNYPIEEVFSELGIAKDSNIIINQLPYIKAFNTLFLKIPLQSWKGYMKAKVLLRFASVLSEEFDTALLNYKKNAGLIRNDWPKWKKGLDFVQTTFPLLLSRAYVENYFNKNAKKCVTKMINNIKDEFKDTIKNSDIFTQSTKEKALDKLYKMRFNVGYPDVWKDYNTLIVKKDDLIGNVVRASNFNYKDQIEKLGKEVDKDDWSEENPAFKVNAFYDPTQNKFVILTGILNKPFFDVNSTIAQNYGGIGTVIAHEIGHAFDDQGSRFDANGNMKNWWTVEDKKAFKKIKNRLIAQADHYQPFSHIYMKGALKVGEIIGDLNGATISLAAYERTSKKNGTKIDYRAFFASYAYIWKMKLRKEYALRLVETDPHPLGEYRANETLRNIDKFFETYHIKKGDKMYRSPQDRIKLW
ncbi:MAG: M13 family metallopeptidase [Sulfurovum sp.]|nr:M13 family metallopeptidase [Sulfurovum sp.]